MWKPAILILMVILIGTIGYNIIEGWSILDSLYMTVITIFTVGFREINTPSIAGQIFTIFIILSGAGTAVFAFTRIGEVMFGGRIGEFWWRKKMFKKIERLKDHYIICGHGRTGKLVRERLQEENMSFIVIDNHEDQLKELAASKDCLYILGDATHEEVLLRAGIKRARGLTSLLPDDADNLYLTMTAKLIAPSLFVLTKVMEDEAEKKILQIGANKVVRPLKLSALKIAQSLVRPTLVDFMDLIIRRQELSLIMEEIVVNKKARITGSNLKECRIRETANVIVVAIKKPGQDLVFNPSPETEILAGDTLLVLGDKDSIVKFEQVYIKAST